ncbi:MAG TPA: SIMPL domain-containing protein [Flavobacteriaceae bacterium]|nr:SIMPL domain-containing protein [Flavobacteriaceae bacterium]HAT65801.1 SIMPL domain-containing protein [Flavobacteriaceae bacterium]|tara:strand:+ start:61824 stop:62501 length:678 start_codon:yes stop_codon:yes gene_type:complete
MKSIALVLTLLTSFYMNAQIEPKPSVDVRGEGVVTITPDQVTITVRVEHTGNNPKEVKQMNDRTVNEVFQFLKQAGIDSKYARTEYMNLSKNYDYNAKKYNYAANQSVSIQLKDLSKYETIMNGLLETGINRIDGIRFSSSKEADLQSEARIKAIQNAKQKATEYASVLGQNIGKALHISEFQNEATPRPMMRSAMAMDSNSESQTMAPGEMEIKVVVNVSFELN